MDITKLKEHVCTPPPREGKCLIVVTDSKALKKLWKSTQSTYQPFVSKGSNGKPTYFKVRMGRGKVSNKTRQFPWRKQDTKVEAGYTWKGDLAREGGIETAHIILAWAFLDGYDPRTKKNEVSHLCGNCHCLNFNHMTWGTH